MYEPIFKLECTGVQIYYHTNEKRRYPVHWHSAIELIYILNGNATIMIEGVSYPVVSGEFIVIDSNQIHEFRYKRESMMIVIYFSRSSMKYFVPELNEYAFGCAKGLIRKEQLEIYLRICDLMKELPPLYIMQPIGFKVKSHAIAMEVFFELINHFIEKKDSVNYTDRDNVLERLGEIADYIDTHHTEAISLEDIASHFHLSREYFSRFFRKNMGITFIKYLNQVRLMHVYQDICNTQTGILELAEEHGFANYKMFNQLFQSVYGCKPREVRRDNTRI